MSLNLPKSAFLLCFIALFQHLADAQCNITYKGDLCIGSALEFQCGSINASDFNWDFNGEAQSKSGCNVSFGFSQPGIKTIVLNLRLNNGQTCQSTLTIRIKAKPVIRIAGISKNTQCFKNNTFCFRDSSFVADTAICKREYFIDDGSKYTFYGNSPVTFCHTFNDQTGSIYGMTIIVTSCNGCVSTIRKEAIAKVLPSLSLKFATPLPKSCDSVTLCLINQSFTPLDSLKSFEWDWGDGSKLSGDSKTPSNWKPNSGPLCHKYKIQGPDSGYFKVTLKAQTFGGCKDSFSINRAALNLILKPQLIANADSLCSKDALFTFKLKDGPVYMAANPLYQFDQPLTTNNTERKWEASHRFYKPGPYKINFSFTHSIPGCGRTIYDTVLVIGPQSSIDNSLASELFFDSEELSRNHQCVIKDTVTFRSVSNFYHNDNNFMDDDSVNLVHDSAIVDKITLKILPPSTVFDERFHQYIYAGFNRPLVHAFTNAAGAPANTVKPANQKRDMSHVIAFWDFDDDYCEACTTDTKNNVNVEKNCKYSKDPTSKHLYKDWSLIYDSIFTKKPFLISLINKDSGTVYHKKLWANDSVAIVRDTILYYGNNGIGIQSKDSGIYAQITRKIKTKSFEKGPFEYDFDQNVSFWIPTGAEIYIDPNNGNPLIRHNGPKKLTVFKNQTMMIKDSSSLAYYTVWTHNSEDTVLISHLKSGQKVHKRIPIPGYSNTDSINANLHRVKFYQSEYVRCFDAKLYQKDIKHPLACEFESHRSLSLMPPSALKLRTGGLRCMNDQMNMGITFYLDEIKPGCMNTWTSINTDYGHAPDQWTDVIGKNLSNGSMPLGDLDKPSSPFMNTNGKFNFNLPLKNASHTFSQAEWDNNPDGKIDIGLIVGNGLFPNDNYPNDCVDTVIYKDLVQFPIVDQSFKLVSKPEGQAFTKFCKNEAISFAPETYNRTQMKDVKALTWSLTMPNSGNRYNEFYQTKITETYLRNTFVHQDSNFLMDYVMVTKSVRLGSYSKTTDSVLVPIARVNQWHTEADVSEAYSEMNQRFNQLGLNIDDFDQQSMAQFIWNGKGIIGKPYTGAIGFIDTAGFGHKIKFEVVADSRKTLHFKDTSIQPIDTYTGPGGPVKAYTIVPYYNGVGHLNFDISTQYGNCARNASGGKKTIVGFYGTSNFYDTILCHGQYVATVLDFKMFEVYPEITFRMLDPKDYWRSRILEAGNPNREGFVRTDLSKEDDDLSNPWTIFGRFPYNVTGLDNAPGNQLVIGSSNGLYYNQDTGRSYTIRTAASDSTGCVDTLTQKIYTTAVRAKIKADQVNANCAYNITLFDSSYVMDPCLQELGKPCDKIVKWSIDWGENTSHSKATYFNQFPSNVQHSYKRPGRYKVFMKVETALGCTHTDSIEFNFGSSSISYHFSGNTELCKGDTLMFTNTSTYDAFLNEPIWRFDFGDGGEQFQYDSLHKLNNPVIHAYNFEGRFPVSLSMLYKSGNQNCYIEMPDTAYNELPVYIHVSNCDTTGLEQLWTSNGIHMYPNPSSNIVKFEADDIQDIMIYNSLGQLILELTVNGHLEMDLSAYSRGLYLVTDKNNRSIGKLILN